MVPKGFLNPEPLLDTSLDLVMPTRGPRHNPTTSGQAPASHTRKPAEASSPESHTGRADTRKQEKYNHTACGTESANTGQNLPGDKLVPDHLVLRGECTAGTHRVSPTEGHFSKAGICN